MITIKVSDSSTRYTETPFDENTATPRSVFDHFGVNYERGTTSLNGRILNDEELDQTFATLGISGRANLNSVVKGDGGAF